MHLGIQFIVAIVSHSFCSTLYGFSVIVQSPSPSMIISFVSRSFVVYSYNLVKGNWQELPRLTPERGYHGVASIEGEMFVVGGFNNPTSETLDTGKLILKFLELQLGYSPPRENY